MERYQENEAKFNLSLNGVQRDLLNKFMTREIVSNINGDKEEMEDQIELSLGLSLNGRFGVDPKGIEMKRSSSISNMPFSEIEKPFHPPEVAPETCTSPLMRACSLPTEAAEDLLHRKELQSMRRLEARKKRTDRLKNARVQVNYLESDELLDGVAKFQKTDHNGSETRNEMALPSPQGSLASGSSGVSETQTQHIDGAQMISTEVKSPSIKSVAAASIEKKPPLVGKDTNGVNEMLKNAVNDMPYVSTKGDGRSRTKIDGLLYGYRKGEEVKILCICHGLFLSPAEFVKHGGGGDVENPLKHIVVNSSPLL